MMKIIGRILIIISALYLMVMPAWFTHKTNSIICSGIIVDITDSSDYHFVTKREIRNIITSGGTRVIGAPVKSISLTLLEERIKRLRELKIAEVYTTIDGNLHVYADQRNPVMRVIADGGDYFVDEDGVVMRRKKLYNPRLHIVGGNINITQKMLNGVSVLDTAIKNSILKDVFQLVEYVNSNNLWSAQIDQVFVDNDDEIDLIPRLGNHRIHLGSIDNFEGKLRNLETFYKDVLPVTGWNKYDLINLEFKDQIVCRKR
jgi:cell division protein FtsQ